MSIVQHVWLSTKRTHNMKNKRSSSVFKGYSVICQFYIPHSPESRQTNRQTFVYYILQRVATFKTKSSLTGIIICGDFSEAGRLRLAVQQEDEIAGACLHQGKSVLGLIISDVPGLYRTVNILSPFPTGKFDQPSVL